MNDQLTSGSILGQTFSLYFAQFGLFFGLCAIVLSPMLVIQTGAAMSLGTVPGSADPATGMPVGLGWSFLVMVMSIVLTNVATAAMVYGVFQQVRNRQATIGECLSAGFNRLLPVIGVSFLVGIITMFGMILCIIPGFIAMVFLAMAIPAVVIERCGVTDSLSRSTKLGEGNRWTVFGVIFALAILGGIVSALVTFLLPTISLFAWAIGTSVVSILWTGVQSTGVTLLYYNLRRVKESIDADDIAQVFA